MLVQDSLNKFKMQEVKIKIDSNSFIKLSRQGSNIKLLMQVESGGTAYLSSVQLDSDISDKLISNLLKIKADINAKN